MKRLFVSAALLPLLTAAGAHAETKITTATTAPVATATAANGQPDNLTIDTGGSIKPAAAGAAVTLNSNNAVKNAGAISFNNLDNSTGILVQAGRAGSVTNSGTISLVEDYTPADDDKDGDLDGPFAKGTGRFGIRLTGAGDFTGDITNAGTITIEGSDSAGISLESRLVGVLSSSGAIAVTGDRAAGVAAANVTGDVRVTGAITAQGEGANAVRLSGDVGGGVRLQNSLTSTGYRYTDRLADSVRAKLDADDLKQGGATVRIAGSVAQGVLLDKPPADTSATDTDEDKDGVPDASEATAILTAYGAAPALDIGADHATTIGAVGTGDNAFGLVNRGQINGMGVNDGVGATALRIGQAGGGATTLVGGVNNQGGTIQAQAFGADVTADGAAATAVLINAGSVVGTVRNSGTISASLANGSQDARAIVDLSGSVSLIDNTGLISAVSTPKSGSTHLGQSIAIDLRANTAGATVRQTKATATSAPAIVGDVLFGAGADRLELSGGVLSGAMSFGAGADALVIDAGGSATGRLTDSDGLLTVDLRDGRLAVTNTDVVSLTSLNVGAKGVLAVNIDPAGGAATRFEVSGAATLAGGSQVDLSLASLQKTAASYQLIHAGSLASAAAPTLAGAPYLYAASLRTDQASNALYVDLRPKTATELGLNRSGAQAYNAVFAALDRNGGIEDAVLAQKTQAGFTAVYDQMLPDHSGGSLASAHAISSAISQAVGSPVSTEQVGGAAVWAEEIMFRIDRDRDQALGYRSQGFGLAAGIESAGDNNAIGLNGSFVTTDYRDRGAAAGEQVSMNFAELGGYWRLQAGGLQANVRGGVGYVHFDGDRRLRAQSLDLQAKGKWSGWMADVHAGAAYEAVFGWAYVRPEVAVDYLRLNEGGYSEHGGGDGFDLDVDKRHGDLMTGEALLGFGARFGGQSWWGPEAKVGYRARFAGNAGHTTARFAGGEDFTLDPEKVDAGGVVLRLGLRGESEQVLYTIGGGATLDDGYREYDIRAVVKVLF